MQKNQGGDNQYDDQYNENQKEMQIAFADYIQSITNNLDLEVDETDVTMSVGEDGKLNLDCKITLR